MEILTQESNVVTLKCQDSQLLLNFGQVSSITFTQEQESNTTVVKTEVSTIYRS